MSKQYAVCHLQRGSGNDSGMSCHIERKTADGKKYVPANADISKTHLNRELIKFPDGVTNRTGAIQHRLENAGLHRKIGKNQTKAVRIILTGTHEQMVKLSDEGKLNKWIEANMKWLQENFGKDNIVSCVLHMDEKTPHLHATVVPIVENERKRRTREGEKKNNTKSGPRLSADDVTARYRLKIYQNTYGEAMKQFGLERGVVGSTAKHIDKAAYYKCEEQALQDKIDKYHEDIERLANDAVKAEDGKSRIFSLFGKGELVKTRKSNEEKDKKITELEKKIETLTAEKKAIEQQAQRHSSDYKTEIAQAIKESDSLKQTIKEKNERIGKLDRMAHPERYHLSSGATLDRIFVPNYLNPSLHIWTKVGNEMFDEIKYDVPYDLGRSHQSGIITDEEFVNAIFEPAEQINEAQYELLKVAFVLTSGGPAQAHVGTGSGGSQSELSWGEKAKRKNGGMHR